MLVLFETMGSIRSNYIQRPIFDNVQYGISYVETSRKAAISSQKRATPFPIPVLEQRLIEQSGGLICCKGGAGHAIGVPDHPQAGLPRLCFFLRVQRCDDSECLRRHHAGGGARRIYPQVCPVLIPRCCGSQLVYERTITRVCVRERTKSIRSSRNRSCAAPRRSTEATRTRSSATRGGPYDRHE